MLVVVALIALAVTVVTIACVTIVLTVRPRALRQPTYANYDSRNPHI